MRLIALTFSSGAAEVTRQEQLLSDIRRVFDERKDDRISSNDLCVELGELEDRPWGTLDNGFRLSPNRLAVLLRPFDIQPHGIRIGLSTPKGYLLRDFEDAFARYLPPKAQHRNKRPAAHSDVALLRI